ncbi:MAG: hypothetical protein V3V30_00490 [Parvularculaceae bacterium]
MTYEKNRTSKKITLMATAAFCLCLSSTSMAQAPKKTQTSEGEATYTLSNGAQVPQKDKTGNTGKPLPDSSIKFPDGTLVKVGPKGTTDIYREGKLLASVPSAIRTPKRPSMRPTRPGSTGSNGQTQTPFHRSDGVVDVPRISGGSDGTGGATSSAPQQRPQDAGTSSTPAQPARPPAERSTASDGSAVYRLGNGDVVPVSPRKGVTGTPNDSGGVDYTDGSTVGVNPSTNETTRTHPDGTTSGYASPSTSDGGQETYTLSNGQQVPGRNPDGSRPQRNPDGSVTYTRVNENGETQQSTIRATGPNETTTENPDGSLTTQEVYQDSGGVTQTTTDQGQEVFVLPNGDQVPVKPGGGVSGRPDGRGGVIYSDGAATSVNPATNGTDHTSANGSTSTYAAPSTASDGTPTYTLSNGQQTPRTNPDGSPAQRNMDGSVTYTRVGEDGTIEEVTVAASGPNHTVAETEGSMTFTETESYAAEQDAQGNQSNNNNGSSNGSSSGNSSGTSSNSNDDNEDEDDDDNDNDDSNEDDSSDDSGDDSSDDSGDSGDDDTGDEGSTENVGDGSGEAGLEPEAKKTVDDFVARKKGEKNTPEDTLPPDCEDQPSGPVSDPAIGGSNCLPGGLPRPSTEEEEEEEAPEDGVTMSAPSIEDLQGDQGGLGPAGQPGIGDEQREQFGKTLEQGLQEIDGVTNPDDR